MFAHRSNAFSTARVLAIALLVLLAFATPEATAGGADQLDPTFGSNGLAQVAVPGTADTKAMAVQQDGKIVLAGSNFVSGSGLPESLAVARVNADGSADLTFGQGGKMTLSAVGIMRADAVTIQADGKIVLAGVTAATVGGVGKLLIVRLTADGAPDTSFNGTGIFSTLVAGEGASAATVAALPGGKILAAGTRGPGTPHLPVAVQVTNTGTLDAGFDGDGIMDIPLDVVPADPTAWNGWVASSVATPDGSVLISGSRGNYPIVVNQIFVAKINPAGVLDSSFGYNGRIAVTEFGIIEQANAIAMAPDGKIVLSGFSTEPSSQTHPILQRLNSNGSLDVSFGVGSRHTLSAPGQGILNAVATDSQGAIVTGGINLISQEPWSVAALVGRDTAAGVPDSLFGDNQGSISLKQVSGSAIRGVAIASGNKILAAGSFADGLSVARLAPSVPAPLPPPVPLSAKISSPKAAKLKARNFKVFAGAAAGDLLAKVQLAVIKTDSKLLKKKKRCLQLRDHKANLLTSKSVKKKCVPTKWLAASGSTFWSFALKKTLRPGKYTLYVRSLNAAGVPQATPNKKSFKLTT